MSVEIDIKIPLFFPYAPKECKIAANTFFECFNRMSDKIVPEDVDAGRRGMLKCMQEMKQYEACMTAYEAKNPPKRMRVSVWWFAALPHIANTYLYTQNSSI